MFKKITWCSVVLALIVVVLGSFVRLSGAQTGCPDWPTCYGQVIISDSADFRAQANLAFPGHPLDVSKAWKELGYRYLFAALSLFVLSLSLLSWREKQNRLRVMTTTLTVLFLLGCQVVLADLAVKLNSMPIIAASRVLLEMITVWLLFGLYLRSSSANKVSDLRLGTAIFAGFAMLVLFLQIALGIWLSTNQGASACSGFPQCNGQWWPQADYQSALGLFNGLMNDYTGIISFDAQVAVNWLHRVGALACFILLTGLIFKTTATTSTKSLKIAGLWLGFLLFVQIGLSIAGLKLNMPLWVTLAHHAVAVLLMLPLIAISFYSRYGVVETAQLKKAIETVPTATPVQVITEEVYIEPAPESLYLRLKTQLKRTRSGLGGLLASLPIGQKEINRDLLEEIEASLIMADIGINVSAEIISQLTQRLEHNQLSNADVLSTALKEELLNILRPCSQPLEISKQDGPFVILVVGVNGAGKTTTIGKLAKRLQAQGHSVMLAAGDTFRAAAVEQLQTWGERNNIQVVAQHTGADSASVIYDALQSAQAKGVDVLIADTAGRLHTKSNLMDELKKVKRIMGKLDETAPHEVLLVLDAGTGQNALSQARLFNETVALTGLVLTKLDGTAKGGVIFALARQFGIPIRYIGIGEGIDDLQDFNAEMFVEALFVRD
ncbi:MAG: signal recognition particle-docking protein FtsY [Methylococcaceae bacterium]